MPWSTQSGGGCKGGGGPWGQGPSGGPHQQPDLEELLKRSQDKLKQVMPGGGGPPGLLVFLVVRNLVKLIFERKRRILGSGLQMRLVLAFVALSLVPSVLLFVISGGFLTRSFDRWFDAKVESALQGALEIGQTYYQNSANNAIFYARQLSQSISREGLFAPRRAAELKAFVRQKQQEQDQWERAIRHAGTFSRSARDGERASSSFPRPPATACRRR